MPLYPKAILELLPENKTQPRITARSVVIHHAWSSLTDIKPVWDNGPLESHFYVNDKGVVYQYMDTNVHADAEVLGNQYAISIETQDDRQEKPFSGPQFSAIVDLLIWCHEAEGIPLVKLPAWDGYGIGYHAQFPQFGSTSCPGPARIAQIPALIAAAKTGGFLMALSDAQQQEIYDFLIARHRQPGAWALSSADGATIVNAVGAAKVDPAALATALLPGLVAALPATATVSEGDLVGALRQVLGSLGTPPAA